MKPESAWHPEGDMRLISPYLPRDTSRQYDASREAREVLSTAGAAPVRILDLGCGRGDSYAEFLRTGVPVDWQGVDIEDSPEAGPTAHRRTLTRVYDGTHIPAADAVFDMVYSRQVFEHVLFPRELLRDVSRVLKVGGVFAGSCSGLEPFHSRSVCNFTPYGFCTLLEHAGFRHIRVRPGVDVLVLVGRRILRFAGVSAGSRFFARESPFNLLLEAVTRLLGFETRRRAAVKLLFSGHFVFSARKVP